MNEQYHWQPKEPNFYESNLEYDSKDYSKQIYDPNAYTPKPDEEEEEEEPPLLEELEIYPKNIRYRMLQILNPFRDHMKNYDAEDLNRDPDLAGPIFVYIILAVCLFLSGNKAHFGYIYGLSVVSCVGMYSLLTLMTSQRFFQLTTVTSILGYSLIPIVGLSFFGIFFSLKGFIGIVLAIGAVIWSSFSASRLFVAISGDQQQQPLIAYPCALVSAVYVLLVIF